MNPAIFVYGLLKPGLRLHHIVAPFVQRSAPAVAKGSLYDAGVPAARFDEDGEIEGFVFWLDPARLDQAIEILDDVEDEGEVYSRITIDVSCEGETVAAQAYHFLGPLDGHPVVGTTWPED